MAPSIDVYLKGETKPISPVRIAITLSKVAIKTAKAAPVGSNHDWKVSRPKARHTVADFYAAQMAGCYAAVDIYPTETDIWHLLE